MAIIKPLYTTDYIWANNPPDPAVDVVRPSTNAGPGNEAQRAEQGWTYGEKPPYMYENWLVQQKDKMLVHLNQTGIMEWDAYTGYKEHAFVNFNNLTYITKVDIVEDLTGNNPPPESGGIVHADWALDIDVTALNTVVATLGNVDANKIVLTDSNGLLDLSLTAIGGMVYNGDIDITIPHPDISTVDRGDYYTVFSDGVFEASWTGLAGTDAVQSETFIYDGVQWNMLGSGVNDNYLLRNGSKPMLGPLTVGVDDGTNIVTNLNGDLLVGTAANPKIIFINGETLDEYTEDMIGTRVVGGNDINVTYDDITGLTTLDHNITSTVSGDVLNFTQKIVSDITFDTYGHVLTLTTTDLLAQDVLFDGTITGLAALNVQDAIDTLSLPVLVDVDPSLPEIEGNVLGFSGGIWTSVSSAAGIENDFTSDLLNTGSGPTSFTVTYSGQVSVFVGGIKYRNTEYTATSGTEVVLNTPVAAGTWVQIVT